MHCKLSLSEDGRNLKETLVHSSHSDNPTMHFCTLLQILSSAPDTLVCSLDSKHGKAVACLTN